MCICRINICRTMSSIIKPNYSGRTMSQTLGRTMSPCQDRSMSPSGVGPCPSYLLGFGFDSRTAQDNFAVFSPLISRILHSELSKTEASFANLISRKQSFHRNFSTEKRDPAPSISTVQWLGLPLLAHNGLELAIPRRGNRSPTGMS